MDATAAPATGRQHLYVRHKPEETPLHPIIEQHAHRHPIRIGFLATTTYLSDAGAEDTGAHIAKHARTGRPLSDEQFVHTLERITGREADPP